MAVRAGVDSIEHGLFLSDHDLEMLGARGGCWVPTVVQMEATISQLGERSSGGRLLIEGLENVRARLGAVDAGVHVLTGTDLVIGSHEVARGGPSLGDGTGAGGRDRRRLLVGFPGYRPSVGVRRRRSGNAVLFSENPISNPRALTDPAVVIRLGRVVS